MLTLPAFSIEKVDGPAVEHICIIADKPIKEETDPKLIAEKMVITARRFSKPVVIAGSGSHRGQRITARDSMAYAERGRVEEY